MQQDEIKQIIANILYLDDKNELQEDVSLFRGYNLSSLDFIDLSFELRQKTGLSIEPESLWPFNSLMTKPDYYANGTWTDDGWKKVCQLLHFDDQQNKMKIDELYDLFTINYIEQYLREMQ